METLLLLGEKGLWLVVCWLVAGAHDLRGIADVRRITRASKYKAWEMVAAGKAAGVVREVGTERFVLDVPEVKKFFTLSSSSILSLNSESELTTTTRGKNFFSNVKAFEAWGIQTHERVLRLADAAHVTPEYVDQMCCNFFHYENRDGHDGGMLIWRMEQQWQPERALCPACRGVSEDAAKYTEGEFAAYVNAYEDEEVDDE